MNMDQSRFATLADQTIEHVADTIDEVLGDRIDADLQAGILTMTLPAGGQYVLNKNGPMCQVWLASPASGAWHFEWSESIKDWVSTREPKRALKAILQQELADLGLTIAL